MLVSVGGFYAESHVALPYGNRSNLKSLSTHRWLGGALLPMDRSVDCPFHGIADEYVRVLRGHL